MKLLASLFFTVTLFAQVRPIPPPGVEVPAADRTELQASLDQLRLKLDKLQGIALLPDVQIFYDAVRYALTYNEFFKPEEIGRAKELLRQGHERAEQLLDGKAPWTTATGLIVRGYRSKIDRSVQPYSLVIPSGYDGKSRSRLDAWFHGRGETLSEVNFLYDRQRVPGEFTPADAIVLHLYGRYCNANKFAGEVDLFEAMDSVKQQYSIDENRIVMRGFSMGGAAAWHIAAHYAGDWAAAAPGAGFSETADFLKIWDKEKPTWWEQKLWHLYDATDYAANLFNCPTVAYSGEIDRQMQAAKMMEKSLGEEGMRLTHIIGPKTGHRYHPDSKVEINRAIDAIVERGRDPYPRKVRFTTWTLRYNRMKWVTIDALTEHWERARLDADTVDTKTIQVKAENVDAFTLSFGAGGTPFEPDSKPVIVINGQKVIADGPMTDRSWSSSFHRSGKQWALGSTPAQARKRHGLQGPIDDAFMNSFVFVRPTGKPMNSATASSVEAEQTRAVREWRRQFRGDAVVKADSEITDSDIANSNLVLWGDPSSNQLLAKLIDKLPISWTSGSLSIGAEKFAAAHHMPALIYPNPLNPKRYVVLNSGFTYRELDYLNNARQVPKLPDYAVIDTNTPPDASWPGSVAFAGFFDEYWKPKPAAKQAAMR